MPTTTSNSTEYLVDGVEDDDLLIVEDEDERPARSSAVQSGWAAAMKATESDKRYTNEFKFTDETQLVKFLTNEPFAVYSQHWIERQGKRSFNCLSEDVKGCPLCDIGDIPRAKVAFSVLNLSAEEPIVEMLITSPTLTRQLAGHDKDPKTGPLDRIFWALSRSGTGKKTVYNVFPVKARDLSEDYGLDQALVEKTVDRFEPLTDVVISFSPRSELVDIAREVNGR